MSYLGMLSHGDPFRLVLVGQPGAGYEEVERLIAKSPIREMIHVTGYVNEEEKIALLSSAAALIHPAWYEGFGIPIVGAEMAFLYFNIYPARLEMSDVGTLPLGILFVFIAVLLNREVSLLLIGGVFMIEILSSFLQVWSVKLRKKRILLVAPIHHHFEKLGWHETKVTSRFWLLNALLVIAGLAVSLL
jgi:UDP-N-acetylmuramyl pentapeptide phosphotransferase/UDP-N-acetylglucosamine-1-phosphate transferase